MMIHQITSGLPEFVSLIDGGGNPRAKQLISPFEEE